MSQATDYAGVEEAAGFQPSGVSLIGISDRTTVRKTITATNDNAKGNVMPSRIIVSAKNAPQPASMLTDQPKRNEDQR